MKRNLAVTAFLLTAVLGLFFLTRPGLERFRKSTEIMSTLVTITVVSDDSRKAEAAIDSAFNAIRELELALSFWTDDSEIAKVNSGAAIAPVRVSEETFELARIALSISKSTSGAFDPTVGPLMRLWDFRDASIPSMESLSSASESVGYQKIKLDSSSSSIFLTEPGMSFDTGGIAKGYAVDRALEDLRKNGIRSALVAIAGDMRAFGAREDGEPWMVGIKDPRGNSEDDIVATLELRDEAVSTSGDYERFFMKDGRRYHHLINPATGYPAEGTMSFTVLAPRAVLTDGYATGAFVLGPEKGIEALREQGLEGIAISTDGKVHVSPGLKSRIEWTSDKYKLVNQAG